MGNRVHFNHIEKRVYGNILNSKFFKMDGVGLT